eukprot:jgi/Tetstr1/444863/TSEL_032705.t1
MMAARLRHPRAWAGLLLAVAVAAAVNGSPATEVAYQALGLPPGTPPGEVVDAFVDLVMLQRSLAMDGGGEEELAGSYRELKEALLAVLAAAGASSCPASYGEEPDTADTAAKQMPAVPEVMDGSVVSQAIEHLNAGNVKSALFLLSKYLEVHPRDLTALMVRGTGLALQKQLPEAKADFDTVVEVAPQLAEGYKRRSQVVSALGDDDAAMADLVIAERYCPPNERSQVLGIKAMLQHKMGDFVSCEASFQELTRLEPTNAIAWNMRGLCAASQGKIKASLPFYRKCIALNPHIREAHSNYADALKETGDLAALEKVVRAPELQGTKDKLAVKAFLHLVESHQVAGNHAYCVQLLDEYNPATCGDLQIHCYYVRGHCMQALGQYRQAAGEYAMALQSPLGPGVDRDTATRQVQSFYMKELALYYGNHVDSNLTEWNMDNDVEPQLKEQWTKRDAPTSEFLQTYKMQPGLYPLDIPPAVKEHPGVPTLLEAAAVLGPMIHYRQAGFAANRRTQRMAGLAIIEAAQALRQAIDAHKIGTPLQVSNAGSSGVYEDRSGSHEFGWRDMYDILVRWRQLTEPNDAVIWIDRLSDTGLTEGFGAHTPIVIGQYLSQRYGSNLPRGIELFKEEVAQSGGFFSVDNQWMPLEAEQLGAMAQATTLSDLYRAMQTSGWTTIMINSTREPELRMEATRLTLLRRPGKADSFDFSIRTPVTPSRIVLFAKEMDALWDMFMEAAAAGNLPAAARVTLQIAYYWYNLMSLARGTAAVGFIGIHAMFLALGMPVVEYAPKGFQLDWAAIFNRDPEPFVEAVSAWLYPPAARGEAVPAAAASDCGAAFCSPADISAPELPPLAEALPTIRQRVRLLNDAVAEQLSQMSD